MGYGRRAWGPFHAGEAPYGVPYTGENEAQVLQQEAQRLESTLEAIKKRLEQLEHQPPTDSK
jgi:hypothetical protein